MDAVGEVVERYARFASDEAPSRSPLYAEWAAGVAGDAGVAEILARLPAQRRQPPLVFAVTRMLGAPEERYPLWRAWLRRHADAVVAETSRRSLQTNEPLRCAALLPALAALEGPIALVELGASAGLCLIPDRYSYRYRDAGGALVALDPGAGVAPVVLTAELSGRTPPLRMPDVAWRAGLDVAPLDARLEADRRFLKALVWPGERGRAERIAAALDLAAAEKLRIRSGDAADPATLIGLLAEVPRGSTPVISTLGLLPHVPRAGRERLLDVITESGAVWISLDPPGAHTRWEGRVDAADPRFVLHRDRVPLARADPLGGALEWLPGEEQARR